ncbi:MAG TPA: IclR family transcriptional regulator [Geminicoccaceae bacterium]|nr:IclR family transcriptional regulator [Geminicoccaceae bacterium]
MRSESDGEALDRHRIPVIDRMMEVLGLLERRPNGTTIRELVDALHLPRTTVYRILNTLQVHGMVRRSAAGSYALGPRLLALAARVLGDAQDYDLAALALPHLERLAEQTGEGSKLSVLDGDGILVIAAAQGTRDYALTVVPGQRLPLHAGAASKVLLAHLPEAELAALLEKPLAGYTGRTLTDPRRLEAELARIRRQGWAQDKGEYAPSIQAFAAPVPDRAGRVVAALSVPWLAGADAARIEKIRASVIAAAGAIAADLLSLRPGQSKNAASSSAR